MSLLKTFKIKEIDRIAISLIIGIIYATSDELHQAFVPGRGPLFTDVIIDSMGILLGILLVMVIVKIHINIQEFKKKRKNNKFV